MASDNTVLEQKEAAGRAGSFVPVMVAFSFFSCLRLFLSLWTRSRPKLLAGDWSHLQRPDGPTVLWLCTSSVSVSGPAFLYVKIQEYSGLTSFTDSLFIVV